MRPTKALLPLTMPLLLAACFGGGGDGGGGLSLDSTPTDFTSVSAIEANALTQANADSSVNYEAASAGGVVGLAGTETNEPSSVLLLTGEDGGEPVLSEGRLIVNFPQPGRTAIETDFTTAPATDGDFQLFTTTDGGNDTNRLRVFFAEQEADELEFMTFGVWELGLQNESVDLGGAAWGATTDVANVPDAGNATYNGALLGMFINAAGGAQLYRADSTVAADFAAGEVELSSTNTVNNTDDTAFAALNISTATPAAIAGNGFSGGDLNVAGDVANTGGEFGGNFFGPTAQEAGGWFSIVNTNDASRYFGSFGGQNNVN